MFAASRGRAEKNLRKLTETGEKRPKIKNKVKFWFLSGLTTEFQIKKKDLFPKQSDVCSVCRQEEQSVKTISKRMKALEVPFYLLSQLKH